MKLPAVLFTVALVCAQAPSQQQQIAAHAARAQELLRASRPDLAIREFNAILALDPNNVEAHGNLAVVSFFQGNYSQAAKELRQARQLRPPLPPNLLAMLGVAERRAGDPDAAAKDLELAFSQLQEEKLRLQTGTELFELHFSRGALDDAARVAGALRTLRPTDPDVLYIAHRVYSQLAGETMLALSMVAPQSARMHQMMAQEAVRQGNTAGAIGHYREAVRIDAGLPGVHFELAEALADSAVADDQAQVESEYRKALAANPFDEKSECRLGEISLKRSEFDAALGRFRRAVELEPGDADANFGLAKTLTAMGRRAEALPALERAARIDPVNATIRFRLGTLYRELGRAGDSRRELAEYQHLREMKDKLRQLYQDMRLAPARQERPEN